jgi:hypothetical protein
MSVQLKYTNIVIGFSRAKSQFKIGSVFIKNVEKRDFSHVYIKYKDSLTDLNIISQASHGLVNEMLEDVFLEHNIIVKEYILDATQEQFISIITFLRKNLGKPYSFTQLFWIGLKKLLRLELNKHNNADNSFICSELAANVCKIYGLDIPGNLDYITPSDLNELLENIYG